MSKAAITKYAPTGEAMPIYDAAMRYKADGTPLVVIAGKEYGTGSSRDWAAKGTMLLGVRAVIAESFERIHRSNLVGMGVLPLQFLDGESAASLGSTAPRPSPSPASARSSRARTSRSRSPKPTASSRTLHRPVPHRHLQRARIFPRRRHPPLRAAEAGRAMEAAMVAACHCGRATIHLPRKPDYVNHCNCSLCTTTGFQGIYYASDELAIDGEFDRYVRSDLKRAYLADHALRDLRHADPLGAADRAAA